jgi:tetratricopeptide (TPR) repeat protein
MIFRLLAFLLVPVLSVGPLCAQESPRDPVARTITVVPFSSAEVGANTWLGKAIADRINRSLAEVPSLVVLERRRIQRFLDELELQDTAFLTGEDAARFGRVAKVDEVVYGSYALRGDVLTINLILVDLETQDAIYRGQAEGSLDDLHRLTARLSLDLLERRGTDLTPDLAEDLQFNPTDSIPATRHFYQAFDHYDHGRLEDAFGEFYAAVERDPAFHEARLWMGRSLQELGYEDLAVIAFEELTKRAEQRVEGRDARMFLASLLETRDPTGAIELYRGLSDLRPPTPHSLEAAHRLAGLLERTGDHLGAYQALRRIDEFVERTRERTDQLPSGTLVSSRPSVTTLGALTRLVKELLSGGQRDVEPPAPQFVYADRAGIRHSRFFDWQHALGLYREAVVHMALLYPKLRAQIDDRTEPPALPRGTFFVAPDNSVITEPRLGHTRPLFHETDYRGVWKERLYAIAVAEGYQVTAAELRISGRMVEASTDHSYAIRLFPFPLPANYHNAWLGAIYGQTREFSRIEKTIPFHGQPHRYLALQIIENHAEIRDWEVRLEIEPVPDASDAPDDPSTDGGFWEGQIVAQLADPGGAFIGPTEPQYRYLTRSKRRYALVDNDAHGITLVGVRGDIGGEPTDLWAAYSPDGRVWSKADLLSINAASEDYAPQLVRAEDGGLRLFWLSDRRGRGWEIWTSKLPPEDGVAWMSPARVPIEAFARTPSAGPISDLPQFAVTQDRRGRWLLAFYEPGAKRVLVLASTDGTTWREVGRDMGSVPPVFGLMLTEDNRGFYRLAVMDAGGKIHLWSSADLIAWHEHNIPVESLFRPRFGVTYSAYLFSEPSGELLLLASDGVYGLQYARFDPNRGVPVRDLVTRAALEAFAVTRSSDGTYLIALETSYGVTLRRYRRFQDARSKVWPSSSPLYTEVEDDADGNIWQRTIARARVILPDVTAVAVASDGRVWWGIETGVFSVKDQDMVFSDVSLGFPFHTTTDVEPCGDAVYFASRYTQEPRIGIGKIRSFVGVSMLRVEERAFDIRGRLVALACMDDGLLLAGTSRGEVIAIRGLKVVARRQFEDESGVTVIALHPGQRQAYVGTASGLLYQIDSDLGVVTARPAPGAPIQGVAVDRNQRLWVAVQDQGLYRHEVGGWRHVPIVVQQWPRFSVAEIQADPSGGLWLLPDPETRSPGLVYVDDSGVRIFNPPHRRLATPVDITVPEPGVVWIATGNDGLYRLERAAP